MISIEQARKRLIEDESWQDHLTDDERSQLLNWVEQRLAHALDATLSDALARLKTINVTLEWQPIGVERAAFIRAMTE